MTKEEIAEFQEEKCNELFDFLNSQSDTSWIEGPEGKWTTGQHILCLLYTSDAADE